MMRVETLASLGELDAQEFDQLDDRCGPVGCHARLLQLERDRRWSTEYLCAREDGRLLAAVPLYRLKKGTWPDPSYDPATWKLDEPERKAEDVTVVGGRSGLLSTLHVAAEINGTPRHTQLIEELLAREQSQSLLLPFLPEDQLTPWKEVLGPRLNHRTLGADARFDRPLAGTGLHRKVRQTFSADDRAAERHGVESAVTTWSEVRTHAAALIARNNQAYGLPDVEQLVDFRVRQWEACAGASVFVLTAKARSEHGAEHGLVVGVIWRDWMDLQEMGLTGTPSDLRRTLYTQLLFHLPIKFARSHGGVRHIRAGLKAEKPKAIRGATFVPLTGATISLDSRLNTGSE